MFDTVSAQRLSTLAQSLPSGPFRLLTTFLGLSKDGADAIYPTAAWTCRALKVSKSTYHRWLRVLEASGLITVTRRKTKPDFNLPNLVRVMRLKRLATWAWARLGKGVTSGIETLSYKLKPGLPPKKLFVPATTLPAALLALVPDAPVTQARVAWERGGGWRTT